MDTYNGWSLRRTIYVGILMVSILCNFYYPIKTRFISLKEQHFLESSKSRDCNIDRLLLEKCSELDFVTLRTYRRLSSNKNAIYVHGTRIINLGENYFISVDDILFGYDILFEKDYLYSMGSWLGVQFQSSPHDAIVFQQLIWKIKPDLIIDLGTNVGGSAVFFASIMSFYSDVGIVLTIDRKSFTKNWVPNKNLLCKDCVNPIDHKLWKKYVHFIQGTTIDPQVLNKVKNYVLNATTIFISQDAAHDGPSVYQDILNYAEFRISAKLSWWTLAE
ncbi:hypothetical protein I4U23_027266 [Adineta vaga]|nr:hypothetical protein I4U23_027266 [Adineta vaga]